MKKDELVAIFFGVLSFTILFLVLETLFKKFAYPIDMHPIDTNIWMVVLEIGSPVIAAIPPFAMAMILKKRGFFFGVILAISSALIATILDKTLFGEFIGSDYWMAFSSVFSNYMLPAFLAGAAGELAGKHFEKSSNKENQL
jgi:hypothetical protein